MIQKLSYFFRPTIEKLLFVVVMIILFGLLNIFILHEGFQSIGLFQMDFFQYIFYLFFFIIDYPITYLLYNQGFAILYTIHDTVALLLKTYPDFTVFDFLFTLILSVIYFYLLACIVIPLVLGIKYKILGK